MAEPVIIDATSSSFWDRVTNWVSENKAVAYTIAGTVVVITGAGAVYYLSESKKDKAPSTPRKSKKERRKEKKEQEEAQKQGGISLKDEEAGISLLSRSGPVSDSRPAPVPKAATVESEDELPEINESTVETFSQEVLRACSSRNILLTENRTAQNMQES
jgi:mitochondrial import receptor subunit TOM70